MQKAFFFAVFAVAVGVSPCAAENQTPRCDAVLAKDEFIDKSNTQLTLAILNTLDQERFQEAKKNANFSVSVPLGDATLPVTASWDQIKTARDTLNTKYQYNYSQITSKNIALASTSKEAIDAWSACIADNATETLTLRPSFKTADNIVIEVYWKPGAQTESGKLESYFVDGATLVGEMPKKFGARWHALQFSRKSRSSSFHLAINLSNGNAGKITFPAEFLLRPIICKDCKASDKITISAGQYGQGKNPAAVLSRKLHRGNYQVTFKSAMQGLYDSAGARPVFNLSLTNPKDQKALATVGVGGDVIFMPDTMHPYSKTVAFQLHADAVVSASLNVGQIFDSAGNPNLRDIAVGTTEIEITRVD